MRRGNICYINGNYFVTLDRDGTKVYRSLRVGESFSAKFPDSIDLKITNKCSFGCPYCHESSTVNGKDFDFDRTVSVLSELPQVGIELAIGGGDIVECCDKTKMLLDWTKSRGFENRITLNYKDFQDETKRDLIYDNFISNIGGVGISIDKYYDDYETTLEKFYFCNKVFHIIVGIFPVEDIQKLLDKGERVLVLGFKQWGRAKTFPIKYLDEWKRTIKSIIFGSRSKNSNGIISFDNLAIEQLEIKDALLEKEWDRIYMGDEFTHSMYIDAVEEKFAPTSRDPNRVSWNDIDILEYFNKYKNND